MKCTRLPSSKLLSLPPRVQCIHQYYDETFLLVWRLVPLIECIISQRQSEDVPCPTTIIIVKSMVYTMNELGSDFQQGGCLYKPTNGI